MKSSKPQTPNPKPQTPVLPKLLITGIEGFTGTWFYNLYKDKYDIHGTYLENRKNEIESRLNSFPNPEPQTPNPRFYKCDITDINSVNNVIRKVKPDYIIHLAALSFVNLKNELPFYSVNVLGAENLLKALVENEIKPKKVILASSANVYGRNAKGIVDEETVPEPVNHYAMSKLVMEMVARNFFDKLNIIITRPFNYTGPGQDEIFLIPKIIKHYEEKKKKIELGNLDVIRDFSDVRFVCACYDKLLKKGKKSQIYNLASGQETPLKKIIEIMNELAGYEIKVEINPKFVRKNEVKRLIGDNKKIRKIFYSDPVIDIVETLRFMYK